MPDREIWRTNARADESQRHAALAGDQSLALGALARQLAGPANGLRLLARLLLGGLFVVIAKLHLAEDAFALHLLLQRFQRLIDIVVPDDDLHVAPFLSRAGPLQSSAAAPESAALASDGKTS